jgi:hypothetical protein
MRMGRSENPASAAWTAGSDIWRDPRVSTKLILYAHHHVAL